MYTLAAIAALAGATLALPSAPPAYTTPATSSPGSYANTPSAPASSHAAGSQPPVYGGSSTTISTPYAPGSTPAAYGSSSSTSSSWTHSSQPGGYGSSSSSASSWAHGSSSSASSWTHSGSSSSWAHSSSASGVVYSSSSYAVHPTGSSASWAQPGPSGYPGHPGQPGHPGSPSWNPPNNPNHPSWNPPSNGNHHSWTPPNGPNGPGSWTPPSNHPSGPGNSSPGNPSAPGNPGAPGNGGWTAPSGPGNGCPVDPSQYCLSYEDSEEAADVFRELIQNYSDELALEYLTEDFVDYSSSVAIIINGGDGEPLDIEKPTFVGRQAFMDAQGSQPEIPFKKLQRFHGCNSVSMRWMTRRSANGQPTETARIPVVGNVIIETVQSNPGDAHNFRIKTIFSEFNSAAWLVNLGVFVPENGTEGDAGTKRSLPADLRGNMI